MCPGPKRINLILMVLLLLIGVLTACNGAVTPGVAVPSADPSPSATGKAHLEATALPKSASPAASPGRTAVPPTPTASPPPTLAVTSASLRGLEIQFWYVGRAADATGQQVDLFNSANEWGIRIQALPLPGYGDFAEAMDAALSVDSLPDLVAAYDYETDGWRSRLVDLNAYFSAPRWGYTEAERADLYPSFWQIAGLERWSLPFKRSGWVLFYNQSWAQELGFSAPPLTPDDFAKQACAAARANALDDRKDNDGSGGWAISTDPATMLAWIYAFGGEVLTSDGGYTFQSQEAAAALAFLRRLSDDGCAWAAPSDHPNDEFAARKALFITGSTGGITAQQAAMQAVGNHDEWVLLPFPSTTGQRVVITSGPSLMIMASAPDRQLAAWLFARWLLSSDNQAQRIRNEGGFPTRGAVNTFLEDYARQNPVWALTKDFPKYFRPEPTLPSWSLVRWAASDALSQVFTLNFTADQIPSVLALLDQIAKEAQVQRP